MTDKLNPCPNCKQPSAHLHQQFDGVKSWKVICHCCRTETPVMKKSAAIAAWNKRQGENGWKD